MCRGSCNIEGSWRATQKNDPPPPICMVWMYIICTGQVTFCWFLGHSSSPVFSLFLCHTPNLLSVRPKWLHLPVSILSISFPYSSLHPAAVSLPAGSWPPPRWALCPGGSWWPASLSVPVMQSSHRTRSLSGSFYSQVPQQKRKTENKWVDNDSLYFCRHPLLNCKYSLCHLWLYLGDLSF